MRTPRTRALPSPRRALLATALPVVATVLTGCALAGDSSAPGGDSSAESVFGHVHGLGLNPADERLYVATHNGLFTQRENGFERVGDLRQDAMSFAVAGPDRFLVSGHPDPEAGGPPHLGLTESTDAGRTWKTLSLEGAADFHALESAGDRVYGADSQSGRLLMTEDGEKWRDLGQLPLVDVEADPSNPESLTFTDGRGAVGRLDLSGLPRLVESAPELVLLDWPEQDLLVGAGPEGAIHRSADGGETWEKVSDLPAPPTAITVTPQAWYAATADGLFESTDDGATWTELEVSP